MSPRMTRRERRAAEVAARDAGWPTLRLPVRDTAKAAVGAAVALALLTEEAAATALGAALAALVWAVIGVVEQVWRRPAQPLQQEVLLDLRTLAATAGRAPAYGIPVPPSIDGVTPRVPRQRLHANR